jgi:serine protease Do
MKRNPVAWAALVVAAAALVSSRGFSPPLPAAAPEIPAEGQRTAKALSEAFEAVADFIKPSVVQITVQRKADVQQFRSGRRFQPGPNERIPKDFEDFLKRFFGPENMPENEQFGFRGEGIGSGFVYDDKGHILTNNHVVANADKITVTFHDGVEATATVMGTDAASDVAVIKVDTTDYHPAQKGRSKDLRVGQWVLAVGSPFRLDQTVTAGIVSATERNEVGINDYESFIQTDASINPGNSGGPLVDMSGKVVGINSAIMTRTQANAGVGFAIPMDMASLLADKLIKDGKISRSRIGIALNALTPALAKKFGLAPNTKGALVAELVKGSPAEKAGLKPGDIITRFDGSTVYNRASLRNLVAVSEAGKKFALTFLRNGHEQTTTVVPAPESDVKFALEKEAEKEPAKPEAAKGEVNEFGLAVQPLTAELASQFGYDKGTQGLIITAIKEGSSADKSGLEVGDLITGVVNDKKIQPIKSVNDFQELAKNTDDLALNVRKPNQPGGFVILNKSK